MLLPDRATHIDGGLFRAELRELRARARLAAIENATIAQRVSEILEDGYGSIR